jgi:predicted nucleic acid-binding protein
MIVVSDTSPLIYLNLVGAIDSLPQLFGRVYVPDAVFQELKGSRNSRLELVRQWAGSVPHWLEVRQPTLTDPFLATCGLHAGEIAALLLAQELQADRLLIDDLDGRTLATQRGFKCAGTLSILEEAARRDLIDLATACDRLANETPFRIGKECRKIIQVMLERDQERRSSREQWPDGGLNPVP